MKVSTLVASSPLNRLLVDASSASWASVTARMAWLIQMVVGAFLSSFKQIGGSAAAGGLYLIYEVIRHVRSKAPGAAAPA